MEENWTRRSCVICKFKGTSHIGMPASKCSNCINYSGFEIQDFGVFVSRKNKEISKLRKQIQDINTEVERFKEHESFYKQEEALELYEKWLDKMEGAYKNDMKVKLKKAILMNKKLYTSYQGINFTPIDFMNENLKGSFRWGAVNWKLVDYC